MHRNPPLRHWVGALLAAGLLGALPTVTATADGILYVLATPPSALEVGCQGPCDCPIVTTPTYGSFSLAVAGHDSLYTYYDVNGYIASFNNGPGAVSITGSGHYRIGGTPRTQQMTLDLEIEGRPPQHFDSGPRPVQAPFPRIAVVVAVHGFYCEDSVLVIDAEPATAGAPRALASSGIQAVRPNPFAGSARITLAIDRAGPATLGIFDLGGREVRTLLATGSAMAGPHDLIWDGRADDGRASPAGVYWVRFRGPSGPDQCRLVKLD
jgi:hypothetical protein